jgi:dipeptidyl aminopeptidase/acylaminoacyl peptidase
MFSKYEVGRIATLRHPLSCLKTDNFKQTAKLLFIILFLSIRSYAQTSLKPQPYSAAGLNQYMWSFSKNRSKLGEKALIDFDAINNWRTLGRYLSVTDNGKYFAYNINRHTGTRYWFSGVDSLVVRSTNTNWRMAFAAEKTEEPYAPGAKQGFFSEDGKQYIFQNGDDLWFLKLGSGQSRAIKNIGSYNTNEKNTWLAWQVKDSDSLTLRDLAAGKERRFSGITDYNFNNKDGWFVCQNKNTKTLLLYNLTTNTERRFSNVATYSFSGNGKALLLKTTDNPTTSLQYVKLAQGDPKIICTTNDKTGIGAYSIDEAGGQVVFSIVDSVDTAKTGIWYYDEGTDKAVLKISNNTRNILEGLIIYGNVSFTDNGKYIHFRLQEKPLITGKPSEEMAGVEVWSYKDVSLQSVQSEHMNDVASYNAIANIESGKIVFSESSNKQLSLLKGDFALAKTDYKESQGDRFWESGLYKDSVWVVSLKDGSSHLLPAKVNNDFYNFWFSPDGNWLVFFDASTGCHYYSYNLHSGELKNISANVPENKLGVKGGGGDGNEQAPGIGNLAAWIDGETSVLVYDNYDIWRLDLSGKQPAVNITSGLGLAKNTVLNLITTHRYSGEVPVIKASEALLLRAFNRKTKQSGFYKKTNLSAATPTKLYMGDYFMESIPGCHHASLSNDGMAPMKAKNIEVWIVQRQSANDAPNYYITNDFKNFRRLSNFQPQAPYRWLTQELHTFKHLDGGEGQGILYKPERFDPAKKYPVVIGFYGQFSNNMYQFRDPNYFDQSMASGKSPAWLLSNGFLVFAPDIAVKPQNYGPKAFSCIEGAAKYLQQLPYVDANKLAFASHSWSSQLGAYLFTHSTTFSAAAITEGLGFGNVISQALTLKSGESKLSSVEVERKNGNLWENKEAWLDQTTVLNADKAKTPVLLLCNKESSEDYQDQTVQLFAALRRLNKRAWWLKYDNGDHTLRDLKELKDYTCRYTQFFDHYLQNAPAPMWMTQGVAYKLKAIENRYELDGTGNCGKDCPVCQAWNKQYERTPAMFQKEIKDWMLDKDIAQELERKQNERRRQLDKEGEAQTRKILNMLNVGK